MQGRSLGGVACALLAVSALSAMAADAAKKPTASAARKIPCPAR